MTDTPSLEDIADELMSDLAEDYHCSGPERRNATAIIVRYLRDAEGHALDRAARECDQFALDGAPARGMSPFMQGQVTAEQQIRGKIRALIGRGRDDDANAATAIAELTT